MIHPTTQINAAELIERLEKSRDEWLDEAAKYESQQRKHSAWKSQHIADGLQEAIEEAQEMAK